jgi:hypothetical protein
VDPDCPTSGVASAADNSIFDEVTEAEGLAVLLKAAASPKVSSARGKQIVISFFTVVLLKGEGLFSLFRGRGAKQVWSLMPPTIAWLYKIAHFRRSSR